jgi:two-component system nitrogen regulation sensor histidine kinase NtrY
MANGTSSVLTKAQVQSITGRESSAARYLFGGGFALAAVVTAATVFLTAAAPGARSSSGPGNFVLWVLSLNLVLILALTAAAGWRAFSLFAPQEQDAGVRLHRRFVSLFALAAVLPAVIVALFFGLLVTQGMDNWFSSRVRTVVENDAATSKAYVDEQVTNIETRLDSMVADLNRPDLAVMFVSSRIGYSALLAQAVAHDFSAVYVIDEAGRVMARAEAPGAPAFLAPPDAVFKKAAAASAGDRHGAPNDVDVKQNVIRVLYRLGAYPDAYLYVIRPVRAGMLSQLRASEEAVISYRQAERSRARIQSVFALSYLSTALLVLAGAVWVGMSAATQISSPVARLVQAADKVAAGDLSARVSIDRDPEEIAVLSRAFNRMTSDLQEQQAALRTASLDAQARRGFIETVLAGVSAGVLGLDAEGRISAANERALDFLGLDGHDHLGRPLTEAAPEIAAVARRAMDTGGEAEAEVDLVRGAETRRLRVRASGRSDGLVLTFDDITRLVTAQRNAAWRDVARRIAHEIKNPLTPIQLSAERLRRKYRGEIKGDLETFDRCTDTIIRQVGDIGRMVDEFSSFARMPAPKFAQEDAAELLRQAVFAQRVAYPDFIVDLEEPEVAVFSADARMVGQALVNVLKNAGEAITSRLAKEPGVQGRITARLVAGARNICFEVEDNGVGLPNRDRERLVEPYVTTREKGTGLGLAIVKRILEEHGGDLALTDASSLPGAKAILRFPRLNAPVADLDATTGLPAVETL